MAKAITVTETRIHCDTCHHEFVGQPPEWLNKACPECGAVPLISDADLSLWYGLAAAREFINALVGDVPDDAPTASFTVSSNPND